MYKSIKTVLFKKVSDGQSDIHISLYFPTIFLFAVKKIDEKLNKTFEYTQYTLKIYIDVFQYGQLHIFSRTLGKNI